MIQELTSLFPNHKPIKTRVIKKLPFTEIYVWVPLWFDFEWQFITPKGGRITAECLALKARPKMAKISRKESLTETN